MRNVDALVFDLYGTLLEVGSVGRAAASVTDDPVALVEVWRTKQLQYTWLRSLMGRYEDFFSVTGDALDYALEAKGIVLDAAGRDRLLDAWLDVAPYPDVLPALAALAPRRLVVLSNGNPPMLEECLRAGGLSDLITDVISVADVGIFKPHPSVYALAPERLGLTAERILFVSSNGFDAAGAKAYGLPVAWINRAGAPAERLGSDPDLVVSDLAELVGKVTGTG